MDLGCMSEENNRWLLGAMSSEQAREAVREGRDCFIGSHFFPVDRWGLPLMESKSSHAPTMSIMEGTNHPLVAPS